MFGGKPLTFNPTVAAVSHRGVRVRVGVGVLCSATGETGALSD